MLLIYKNFSHFLAKMAEILGIVRNGLLGLIWASFYREYVNFIQKLRNFDDILQIG